MGRENDTRTLGQIAHEMRTPLNCIIGLIESSLNRIDHLTKKKMLEPALSSAKLLSSFIHDLLDQTQDFSGKLSLMIAEFELKPMLKDILNLMVIQAG